MPRFHRGMCQLEKPPQNPELPGKAIVLQSRFRRTRFSRGQQRTKQNERIKRQNKTKTNRRESTAAWFQGGARFGQ